MRQDKDKSISVTYGLIIYTWTSKTYVSFKYYVSTRLLASVGVQVDDILYELAFGAHDGMCPPKFLDVGWKSNGRCPSL